ncbi:DUF1173 domain-containing protein [Aquabacterium soli]|uniref:DUF1173 domain-containing protein n=1 Tax=Aquabacterium soli TaxID=2493092 RepID=A0A3R8S007_9BURK|nr:DUF1173 family protein [Aquabacterium soli]RRS01162.1 DUF1173 domain-containing protein [Aquabacterium soli]
MPKYLFGNHVYSPEHESWQRILQKGYAAKLRPICQCLVQGERPALYIALARGQYLLKRLPYSGPLHAPHCEHYEPPPELSGLGQVNGSAIREELETQTTTLALDFALTKGRSRQPGAAPEVEHESVRSDGTKLTMRGLLHFLMDEAGLTRWTPAMTGRRSWWIVRRELLNAASSKTTKGQALLDVLFIPESFSTERADEIRNRQREALSRLAESTSARMVMIAEVKQLAEEARFGKSMVIKHMPDIKLMVTDDMHKHLLKRFGHQLQLWGQLEGSKLMMIATISRSAQGLYSLESACLMNVNDQWLPFESMFEWELMAKLHTNQRRFTRGLRYNLPSDKPLACAVLQDTGDQSTAMFVVPQGLEGEYDKVMDELSTQSNMQAWQWSTANDPMPDLPQRMVGQHERP